MKSIAGKNNTTFSWTHIQNIATYLPVEWAIAGSLPISLNSIIKLWPVSNF